MRLCVRDPIQYKKRTNDHLAISIRYRPDIDLHCIIFESMDFWNAIAILSEEIEISQ